MVVNPAACFSIWGGLDSDGKASTTLATLSLISFAASSKSISVSNSILIVLFPFSDFESMFLIPSAPPMTSSITWVTSSSIIGADADLYSTLTCTTGGCNPDGSSLTGNFEKTKIPNIIKNKR